MSDKHANAAMFWAMPKMSISSVSPSTVSKQAGWVTLTITGSGFLSGMHVTFHEAGARPAHDTVMVATNVTITQGSFELTCQVNAAAVNPGSYDVFAAGHAAAQQGPEGYSTAHKDDVLTVTA